jgi:beta-lactam-binding protein with PASTA domain/predicted Ser/Thr protein kinase
VVEIREGSVIDDRYRVLRRIGSGGMADVWLAEDTHLQRQVALKVLHHRFAQDREFVERFRREAEAAAGLQHPNVVGVFDRGEVDGTYYIAMEYIEGRSLKELIDGGLAPDEAVRLVRQVLEAARFAHRRGVIHRDLKPHNVIVDAEGNAKVADFGIARAGVSEITQTGSVMGTAHYLSPEQAQGLEVTAASDLYSIGVILYEALTGRVPFEGDSAVAVALKQVSQAPQRPSALNPQVSPALDAVVIRALEKDPARRFQDADAFIAALDAAQRDPAAPAAGTAEFAPPPPPVAVVEEPAVAADEEREERKRRGSRWIVVAMAVLLGLLVGLALTRDTTTGVPKVTGEQLRDAILLLQQDGFDVGDIKRVQRQAPRNRVLEQDPAASPPGKEASLDCALLSFFCDKPKITLTVSAGPGSAKVPPTRGLTRDEATSKLEKAGFKVGSEGANSDTIPAGEVIRSDPAAGTTARRGSEVTIVVSIGPKLVSVPVVVGVQRSVAMERLSARGLVPSVSEREDEAPEGEVLDQSPNAGERIERGSTVSIVVSKGVAKVKMPNVIGDLRPDAVQALRALGLRVTVDEQDTDVEAQDGRVVDQFPPPGRDLQKGDSVTIQVGKFVAPTTTPTTPSP